MRRRTAQSVPTAVAASQCRTCIFRADGNQVDLVAGRMAEIQSYLIKGTPHQCHTAGLSGRNLACRGGRDFQLQCWHRMGMIANPSDEALVEAMRDMGLEPQTTADKHREHHEQAIQGHLD